MVTALVKKIIKFMFQKTTAIFILFFTNQFVLAQNVSLKSSGDNLKTKIRQAYHLEQIPDDASYRLEILKINGNITIIGTVDLSTRHLGNNFNFRIINNFFIFLNYF